MRLDVNTLTYNWFCMLTNYDHGLTCTSLKLGPTSIFKTLKLVHLFSPNYIKVNCPTCGRCGDIKLSTSCDYPDRLFYKCPQCGKFMKWAIPINERDQAANGSDANRTMMLMMIEQLRNIKRVVEDINGRVFVLIVVMTAIVAMLATK